MNTILSDIAVELFTANIGSGIKHMVRDCFLRAVSCSISKTEMRKTGISDTQKIRIKTFRTVFQVLCIPEMHEMLKINSI